MTHLKQAVEDLELRGKLSEMGVSVEVHRGRMGECLHVRMGVPDRDGAGRITVQMTHLASPYATTPIRARQAVASTIKDFILHEVDESIWFDGEIFMDPHAGE